MSLPHRMETHAAAGGRPAPPVARLPVRQDGSDEPRLSAAERAVNAVVGNFLNEAVNGSLEAGGPCPSAWPATGRGVPPDVLKRSLWQAHTSLLDGMLECLATGATGAAQRALASFTVACCEAIAQAHHGEERAPDDGQERQVLARRILYDEISDISDADAGEVERQLGFSRSDNHWAIVLWATSVDGAAAGDLAGYARAIARSVGDPRPLILDDDASKVSLWVRWPRTPGPDDIASTCGRLPTQNGLRACAGPVLPGLAGFRRTMLLAQATRKAVRTTTGDTWHHYGEDSVLSLLIDDQEWSHWFVEDALRELSRQDAWSATLRETLRLYLAHGRSRQQVAAALYINRNTVAYRVQKAEQLLGRPIDKDTFQLRLALEIARRQGTTAEKCGS